MGTYTLNNTAYIKLVLHAAKHPHAPVNGVLLGVKSGNDVSIVDTVPLLHHWTSLSPMMEIGLDLARSHAEERHLKIVGYYQATERPNDPVLVPVGEKVSAVIKEGFENAFALVIDGSSLGSGDPALIPHLPSTSKGVTEWLPQTPISGSTGQFCLADPASPSVALEAVRVQGLHHQFGDFDDHLEDVTIDWLRNAPVSYLISP
ncbi:hypothetical protein BS47DRAFT_1325296 [Hydnum rufescens UP504]|uniref:MPN domain-containing protein n=1 Tax=Hydnum rufescens UP504 TaxID=1448309 RepID=A0A9P6B6B0_9AGAM|nr:hypothetical protein BS47DRAFT_1325296 [Hydnum rufescens UP504]